MISVRNQLKLSSISVITFLVLGLSGCATSWVQKSPEWKPEKSTKVLLGSYRVTSSVTGDCFLSLSEIIDGNLCRGDESDEPTEGAKKFAEMSLATYPLVKKHLEKYNLYVSTDKKRTLNIGGGRDNTERCTMCSRDPADRKHQWIHPDGSKYSFINISNAMGLGKDIADELKGDDKEEVFLSAETYLQHESSYGLWKGYLVTLSIKILNQNGDTVFQAKGQGNTNFGFFDSSYDEGRIQNALVEAIGAMNEVEIENEISAITSLSASTSGSPNSDGAMN
jgi:hypothetical protein